MIFLGILINGEEQVLCVPEDKKFQISLLKKSEVLSSLNSML